MRRIAILSLALLFGCEKDTPSSAAEKVAQTKTAPAPAQEPRELRADEPVGDPATRHLPAAAHFVVRFASLERLDAVSKKLALLWELVEDRRPLSKKLLPSGIDDLPIDRSRPCYWTATGEGQSWLFHAQAAATLSKPPRLPAGMGARLADGMIRVGPVKAVDGPRRAEPLAILRGDVSFAVSVAELASDASAQLEKAQAEIERFDLSQLPFRIPPVAVKFVRGFVALGMTILRGTDSAHYALTWRQDKLYSEGWIRTLPGSELRRFLARAPEQAAHRLVGYLPREAFLTVDTHGLGSWLDEEVAALLDSEFGSGAGFDMLMLLAPSYGLAQHLDGRGAGTIAVTGLMSVGMQSIWEIKPGAPIQDAIEAIDAERINKRLADLELPFSIRLERNVDTAGDTKIHRITYHSPIAQAALVLPQMQTCFAVEGGYLLTVQSMTASQDIQSLIARVRAGKPSDHPHLKAMSRLTDNRHEGMTINLGALKPMVGMAAAFLPESEKVVAAFPDRLYLSTALTVTDGHVHLQGDWPVTELLRFAASLK